MTEKNHGRGRPSKGWIEQKRYEVWTYYCKNYSVAAIATATGLSRKTVSKYIDQVMAENRRQREQRGYDDLTLYLAREETIMSEAWTAIAEMDRALDEEDQRRDTINAQRVEDGGPPLPTARYDMLGHWLPNRVLMLAEVGRANERIARVLGLFPKGRAGQRGRDWQKVLQDMDKRMKTVVTVSSPDPREVPLDWLSPAEREHIEEQAKINAALAPLFRAADARLQVAYDRTDKAMERAQELLDRMNGTSTTAT